MSFSRPSAVSGAAACVLTSVLLTAQVAPGPSTLEQRIHRIQDRIQDGLLPAVLVKGEPVQSTKLADRMAALHVPGVSIAVIHDGQIEWARGFGVTSLGTNKTGGPAVTPETLSQAASISKPVTALAALQLVQSGKLDLDTDVNRYLKTWKVPDNEFTAKTRVTLRELLTHTAGMTVHGFPGYASGAQLPTLTQVLNGEKPANTPAIRVDTTPGSIWRYSGGGYVIVQQSLEDVSSKPFAKLMQETVLGPIGMTRSTYEQPLPTARLAEIATPYRENGEPVTGGPHTYPEMAPAGLWTTPSDLARYAIEVQRSLAGKSDRVLSAAMARQMLTPGMNQQGLGPQTGGGKEHPYFTHGGANEGYRCNLVAYENGDGAVIMTNSDAGGQLADEILRTIAYEYKWPDFQPVERTVTKADPKVLDGYVGAYQLAAGAVLTMTRDGDQMYVQLTGQPKFEIFPTSDREFFLKVVDAQLTFDVGADGKATQLTLHQNGMGQTAARMSESEAKRVAESQAAAAKRFQDQTQDPRTEAVLRRLVDELRRGEPAYDQMTPEFANLTRQQLPQLQSTIQQLGAMGSLSFKGVGPGGLDIYEVQFEKGVVEFRIALGPDGKVAGVGFRPQ
jgi:CubicO group peptidase (beta-lactamase class C family)